MVCLHPIPVDAWCDDIFMARGDSTDYEWQQPEPLLPPQTANQQTTNQQGNQYKDHRSVVIGIL